MSKTVQYSGQSFEVADQPADFWGWVKEGRYNREWHILTAYIRPEHTFLDLGAWVGSHSLLASRFCKRVIALEPDPVAFEILKGNLACVTNAEYYSRAITNYKGIIILGSGYLGASTTRANREAGGGIGAWEDGHVVGVNCSTLRDFVGLIKDPDPLFIKIDVEGSEEAILQDLDFFREHKPTVYLETHPFWWKDVEGTWKAIADLAAIYNMPPSRNTGGQVFSGK